MPMMRDGDSVVVVFIFLFGMVAGGALTLLLCTIQH